MYLYMYMYEHVCTTPKDVYIHVCSLEAVDLLATRIVYAHTFICDVTVCRRRRLTVHEALDHPWLSGDLSALDQHRIPASRYNSIRDKIRLRYVSVRMPVAKIVRNHVLIRFEAFHCRIFLPYPGVIFSDSS